MTDTDTGPAEQTADPAENTEGVTKGKPGRGVRGKKSDGNGQGNPESKNVTRKPPPDTSDVTLEGINAATLALPDLVAASAPTRERSEQQKAMDEVAKRAYQAWIDADKPSMWQKIPVVTYFLTDEELPKYRYLIRRACAIVEPIGDSRGVRERFGNVFTLSEQMASKVNRPDLAGRNVLAWAAVDKRATAEDKKEE